MAPAKDLYAALGVSRNVSKEDLRSAYRKLARQYHPDVRPGDKAAEDRFKEVTAAHEVLGDDKKRRLYDEFGEVGLREGFDAQQARAYGGFGGGGTASHGQAPGGFDLGDMFGDLFGGGRGGRARGVGQDLAATVEIDLAEAVRGTELNLSLPQQVACDACSGSGAASASPTRCSACRGSGQIELGGGRRRCPQCGGKGQAQTACRSCAGQGTVERTRPVTVRVPAGADHGSKLRVPGRGGHGARGAGDLWLETRIRPHPWFRKEGLDLVVRLPLTVAEAMLGAQVEVPTPTGTVKLRVPPASQSGTRLRLRGRGVQRGSKQGDMFAEIDVRVPGPGTAEQQAAARSLDAAYEAPVRGSLRF